MLSKMKALRARIETLENGRGTSEFHAWAELPQDQLDVATEIVGFGIENGWTDELAEDLRRRAPMAARIIDGSSADPVTERDCEP